jgi:drug/metabolite transporter (DMT)-like permease
MTSLNAYHATETGKLKAAMGLLAATAVFGLGNVVQKAVLEDLDGWMSLGLRASLALTCLAPWALAEFKTLGEKRRRLLGLLPLVMLGFAIGMTFQVLGAGLTSATNLGFLINLSVVFTPVLCWLLGQQKLDRVIVISCVASVAGAALLSHGSAQQFGLGDVLCVAAAVGFAIWIMALQRAASELQCPALLTFMQWILPMIIGFSMTEQNVSTLPALSTSTWLEIAFLGICSSGLAYLVAASAQAKLSSVTAALIYPAEAVFGALAALVWLGETLSPVALFGACMTLASIAIVSLPAGSFRFTTLTWRVA